MTKGSQVPHPFRAPLAVPSFTHTRTHRHTHKHTLTQAHTHNLLLFFVFPFFLFSPPFLSPFYFPISNHPTLLFLPLPFLPLYPLFFSSSHLPSSSLFYPFLLICPWMIPRSSDGL